MWYAYDTGEGRDGGEPVDGGEGGNWIMLPAVRVKEIIELNKQNQKPADLRSAYDMELVEEAMPDYENVVGQDRIDRMDRKKKHKKKKRRPDNRAQGAAPAGGQQQGESQGGGPRPEGQPRQQQQGQRPQGQPRQQGGGQG